VNSFVLAQNGKATVGNQMISTVLKAVSLKGSVKKLSKGLGKYKRVRKWCHL